MTDYAEYQVDTAPSWLSRPNGVGWNYVLGLLKDSILYAAKDAIYNRFASRGALDSLSYLAAEKDISIGYSEGEAQLRSRVKGAWDSWEKAGTEIGLREALILAGYPADNIQIREKKDVSSLEWYEFEVWLIYPFPWADPYDDDGFWDIAPVGIWDDGGVWTEDVPMNILNLVRSIIAKWKPTHTRCRYIALAHAGDFWTTTDVSLWGVSAIDLWDENVTYHTP